MKGYNVMNKVLQYCLTAVALAFALNVRADVDLCGFISDDNKSRRERIFVREW